MKLVCLAICLAATQAAIPSLKFTEGSTHCTIKKSGSKLLSTCDVGHGSNTISGLAGKVSNLENRVTKIETTPTPPPTPPPTPAPVFRTCLEAKKGGQTKSGIYTINPPGMGQQKVYCDMDTDGGGWILTFTRRVQVQLLGVHAYRR